MNKNDKELQVKVHSAMYTLVKDKGVASPAEVLIAIGALSKDDYERWRRGQVDFLERVCKINLRKLSFVNHEIRAYARKHNLKASWTFYNKWGKKRKDGDGKAIKLRFSKSGDENIEKQYATHYVCQRKVEEIKARRVQNEADMREEMDDPICEAFADESIPAYARCRTCFKDMRVVNGCQPYLYSAGGKKYRRIWVGDVGDIYETGESDLRCTDCGAKRGYPHHVHCKHETCPVCRGNKIYACRCALFDTKS